MDTTIRPQCDLHIHSTFSDSDSSIENIFSIAKKKNLSCIALTDHDTVDGLSLAREVSTCTGIECIDGIEISAQHGDVEIHVLGYYIDPGSRILQNALIHMRELRRERYYAMAEKLSSLGIKVDTARLAAKVIDSIPTRLHLGLYLVEKKVVRSLREAFIKYLSPGKPAYIARFKYSVKEAIELIHSCGGLAFIAHPQLVPDQKWIEEFAANGADGLEVVYPRFSPARIALYSSLADRLNILKSGGSDAHGNYKEYTSVGAVTIAYEWVEAMKKRVAERKK
ncbi:MAG: PHP domain-containing protein [Candidatus Omnitrophota bacterium]